MSGNKDPKQKLQWGIDLRTVNNELEILQNHLLDQIRRMKTALKVTGSGVAYIREIDTGYASALERLEKFVLDGDHPAKGVKPGRWISALDYISKHNHAVYRRESDLLDQLIDLDALQSEQKILKELLGYIID